MHEEAERLERHISTGLEQRIAAALGDPSIDPHGHPIPRATGTMPELEQATTRLAALTEGQRAVIASVNDDDPEILRHLAAKGMYPGYP